MNKLPTFLCAAILFSFAFHSSVSLASDKDLAKKMTLLLRSARAIFIQKKSIMKNPMKSGLDLEKFMERAKTNYKRKNDNVALDESNPMIKNLLQAITNVMNKAFTNKNFNKQWSGENDKTYFRKGVATEYQERFLPARFARLVVLEFSKLAKGKAEMRLTAPENLLTNRMNKADSWEALAMKNKFSKASWPKDKTFSEVTKVKNKDAFRLILPEYYSKACLKCHSGDPGQLIHKAHPAKEPTVGSLGGVISVTLFK